MNVILMCFCKREQIEISGTKYIVREQIAEGGFSVIFLVENQTRRRYALKKIVCHSIEDEEIAYREVEVCKKIRHKNVIELIDYIKQGQADMNATSQFLIVFPYYRNGTLHNYLALKARSKVHVSKGQILHLFLGICEGLKALHDNEIAHRDLSTANICLSDSMEPIIIDIGSSTQARVQICGQSDAQKLKDIAEERCSMLYRPPELFSVESYCFIDERTDIWSLGCVLFALCFFKGPFDAAYERGDSVALAVLSANISIPNDSPYGEDIHDIIKSMLRPINERPFINSVIDRVNELIVKLENCV